MATLEDFEKIDIRVGKILTAEKLEDGKYSTHILQIDFGKGIGTKKSCARLINYDLADLPGKLILAVINFPPRQIGKNMSEVLTLGIPDGNGECFLIRPDSDDAEIGGRLY